VRKSGHAIATIGLSLLPALPLALMVGQAQAQLTDKTQTNTVNAGINKSFADEANSFLANDGRGDVSTPGSSLFIINRDPFRAIRRGRQIFQRKFTRDQGQGPRVNDASTGDLNDPAQASLGAGMVDSCGGCHGRPRGSAGAGGDVATRPDSRNAAHLFGIGLREMLADEITGDLRAIRANAVAQAANSGTAVTVQLTSKGISFGRIHANPDGTLDTSGVQGVDPDLRVRPFFAQGGSFSIREFAVGALKDEMGLEAVDPDLLTAHNGGRVVTPSGLVLDGKLDTIKDPPVSSPTEDGDSDGVVNEIPTSIVDFLEFYLLNYFAPATYEASAKGHEGLAVFNSIGCQSCHIQNLQIDHDRRVADVNTRFDAANGIFNELFSQVTALTSPVNDGSGFPAIQRPIGGPFLVRNIFTDLKRHDLGPNFYERNYNGTIQQQFITRALWGVGSLSAHGHDGRSINLREVIFRHGGEAQSVRDGFAKLPEEQKDRLEAFLDSLVLFPPDDTASNLDPGNRSAANFPQVGHGSIKLTVLFDDPTDPE
jgi:Di-haem oxidoreductase, putative peroxidase